MVICKEGTVKIEGGKSEVLAEVICILHSVYERLVECEGEEDAAEQLGELFEVAIMSKDEIEEAIVTEEQRAEIELLEQEPTQFLS